MQPNEMRPNLAPEERRSFQDVAALFYESVPLLAETLAHEVERPHAANAAMANALTTSRDNISDGDTRKLFDDLHGAQAVAYSTTDDVVKQTLERLGGHQLNPTTPPFEDLLAGYSEAAAEKIVQLMDFDVALIRFFHAAALTSLYSMVSRYIDVCEAYLGREIGSHDAKKRLVPVLRELALALAAIPAPILGFVSFAVEAFKQARETPERAEAKRQLRDAEGMARQKKLRDSLGNVADGIGFDAHMANTSVDGVLEGRANFTEAFKRYFSGD